MLEVWEEDEDRNSKKASVTGSGETRRTKDLVGQPFEGNLNNSD